MRLDRIHVFLGTKAQYIKTAPLLRLMNAKGVDYRLIDSGQHAALSVTMRADLGVRAPDLLLGGSTDVESILGAIRWGSTLAARLWSSERLHREVFGGAGGICVVHGDTPSTVLAALMARRAGLRVAHLEAGLRSHSLRHPFPEEAIRVAVMRVSDLLFAPDPVAVANLHRMRLRGRVIPLSANTSAEALRHALECGPIEPGPAIVTMHRVENLRRRSRVEGFLRLATRVAAGWPTTFVVHGPTAQTVRRLALGRRLRDAGIDLVPLQPHHRFVRMLAAAPLVVTDGGSIQEECALIGVPTLLWRRRTERPDGLGLNVVLSRYDPRAVDRFLADPGRYRRARVIPEVSPSEQILGELLAELAA
jgi:UDP-N-acetylglucosamine 2-epimerase (non-hydrolysing)